MSTLSSLLLCRDEDISRVFTRVLRDLEVDLEMCSAAEEAQQRLSEQKFDAVLVDCNADQQHISFIQGLRSSAYSRRALVLAVVGERDRIQEVRQAGAHLVVESPVAVGRLATTMRVARNLMDRERRRAFRRSVHTLVNFTRGDGHKFDAFIADLSRTGMALRSTETLFEKGSRVSLRFHLPATEHFVEVHATVVRSDDYGQTGFHFNSLPAQSEHHIENWLRERRQSLRQPVMEILAHCSMNNVKDFPATVLNLSGSGAAIRCSAALCSGMQLKMRMTATDTGEYMELSGSVAWADRSGGVGVRFIGLSSECERLLAAWMQRSTSAGRLS